MKNGTTMVRKNKRSLEIGVQLPQLVTKTAQRRSYRDGTESNKPYNNRPQRTNPVGCLSERSPRPKPERQSWTPMSDKESRDQSRHYGNDGLYSKEVERLYNLLTRENSVILPPIMTSRRMKYNILDEDKLREKRYIMRDVFTEGKVARYARDQCYVPSVYSEYLNCRTCKKSYIDNKYMEEYKMRNHRKPNCSNWSKKDQTHFCDVLGKRCCAKCIEAENRIFSRRIEDRLTTPGSTSSISDIWS